MNPDDANTDPSTQAPQTPPATPPSQAEAPVTRAEFDALMAKLDKLDKLGAPASNSGQQAPQTPQTEELPAWAKALGLDRLAPQIESLANTQAAQQLAAKKGQLLTTVLAGVPESNRGLATLAVEGLLASSGMDLAKNADLPTLAVQLRNTLVENHRAIFATPGSQFSAIPAKGDGTYDWSGVNSLSEVSAEMLAVIPQDVYRRLASGSGAGASTSTTRDAGGVVAFRPRNKF